MPRTIGGNITPIGLAALMGDKPERSTDHEPPNVRQLADARDHVRRAVSALRAIDAARINGEAWQSVGRCAAALVDVGTELDRIARRQPATPYE